jgi:phosphatidate cytidylyltransferase
MPLDLGVFKTRALSAIAFGVIMLAALLGGKLPFIAVFAIVCFVASTEYLKIQEHIHKQAPNTTVPLLYALSMTIFFLYLSEAGGIYFLENIKQNRIAYIATSALLLVMAMGMLNYGKVSLGLLSGYIYVPLGFAALAQCFRTNNFLPLALIVLIWVNDTMQYVVGSLIGKHKMAPIISPKKTWEGTIGGSALSIAVACVWGYFDKRFTMSTWLGLGFCASIAGTLGDLLESWLKRKAGIKDSGNIMPGHGGALDRFDSILLAAPVLWVLLKFIVPIS